MLNPGERPNCLHGKLRPRAATPPPGNTPNEHWVTGLTLPQATSLMSELPLLGIPRFREIQMSAGSVEVLTAGINSLNAQLCELSLLDRLKAVSHMAMAIENMLRSGIIPDCLTASRNNGIFHVQNLQLTPKHSVCITNFSGCKGCGRDTSLNPDGLYNSCFSTLVKAIFDIFDINADEVVGITVFGDISPIPTEWLLLLETAMQKAEIQSKDIKNTIISIIQLRGINITTQKILQIMGVLSSALIGARKCVKFHELDDKGRLEYQRCSRLKKTAHRLAVQWKEKQIQDMVARYQEKLELQKQEDLDNYRCELVSQTDNYLRKKKLQAEICSHRVKSVRADLARASCERKRKLAVYQCELDLQVKEELLDFQKKQKLELKQYEEQLRSPIQYCSDSFLRRAESCIQQKLQDYKDKQQSEKKQKISSCKDWKKLKIKQRKSELEMQAYIPPYYQREVMSEAQEDIARYRRELGSQVQEELSEYKAIQARRVREDIACYKRILRSQDEAELKRFPCDCWREKELQLGSRRQERLFGYQHERESRTQAQVAELERNLMLSAKKRCDSYERDRQLQAEEELSAYANRRKTQRKKDLRFLRRLKSQQEKYFQQVEKKVSALEQKLELQNRQKSENYKRQLDSQIPLKFSTNQRDKKWRYILKTKEQRTFIRQYIECGGQMDEGAQYSEAQLGD